MRNSLFTGLILINFLMANNFLFSQIEFGFKVGLSSMDLISQAIRDDNGQKRYELNFYDASYGHHLGLYTRIKLSGIYIEPAVIYNSNKADYKLKSYTESGLLSVVVSEQYCNIDIPLILGIKAGFFRIFAGPVAKLDLSTQSSLPDFTDFPHAHKSSKFALQAGFGLDIWKLRFEISYEGNLSRFGGLKSISGNENAFNARASRIVSSVGYRF